jgi:hypothetical protein
MAKSYAKSSGWMLKPPLVLVNSCENLAQILVGQILNIPCTPANQENTMDNSIIDHFLGCPLDVHIVSFSLQGVSA